MAEPAERPGRFRGPPSLRRRFAVWFGLLFIAGAVGLRVMHYNSTVASLARDLDVEIRSLLDVVAVQERVAPAVPIIPPDDSVEFAGFAGVWRRDGTLLDDIGLPTAIAWDPAWAGRLGSLWTTADGRHRLAAASGAHDTLIVAGAPLKPLAAAARKEAVFQVATFVFWVPIVLGVAWLMLSQLLVPVAAIAETARRIRAGVFEERIDVAHTDSEFVEMAGTINDMVDRLEAIRLAQSRFNADLAHQLMNPVHGILLESDAAAGRPRSAAELSAALGRVGGLARRIEGICEVLLAYSRSAALDPTRLQPIDVEPVVAAAIDRVRPHAAAMRIAIQPPAAGAVVKGDAALLEEVFVNLLVNAVEHSPADATIEVVVEDDPGACRVAVVDHGAGVSAQDLPQLFERLHSGKPGGHGIGLTLSRLIARSHGGDIVHEPTPGGGATFSLRLPRSARGAGRRS